MADCKYERKQKTIKTLETGKAETFPSVNAAKRASRELQMANGGLGTGFLRVVK